MKSILSFKNIIKAILAILVAISTISCAMIMHGTFQDIGISSNPTGAIVSIDNTDHGVTPVVAKLSRKTDHKIAISLDGYEPYEITLTRTTSSWVLGNIIFGGLIGLAIDAISGGIYKLTPEQISAELKTQTQSSLMEDNNIFIIVSLAPKSDWKEIGKLQLVR